MLATDLIRPMVYLGLSKDRSRMALLLACVVTRIARATEAVGGLPDIEPGAYGDQVHARILPDATSCNGFDEEVAGCPNLPSCDQCSPIDCAFADWGDWYGAGGCSGLLIRQRNVAVSNNHCGRPCDGNKIESKVHILPECTTPVSNCEFTQWSEWTSCSSETSQKTRERSHSQPVNGGAACSGIMKQTAPCGFTMEGTPCELSDWHVWTQCSTTCGEGRQSRLRQVTKEPMHGGAPCAGSLLQTEICKVQDCPSNDCKLSPWTPWSLCDPKTHPQRYRARHIIENAQGNGTRCQTTMKETMPCSDPNVKAECKFTDWTKWSACDKTCDGGQTDRSRALVAPCKTQGTGGKTVLKEIAACNAHPCVKQQPNDCQLSSWGEWSNCSSNCGTGSRTRMRTVQVEAKDGGVGCEGPLSEVAACKSPGCPSTDCKWSDWYAWSACTCTCGGGTKRRTRFVASPPRGAGILCDPLDKSEAAPCNTQPCGTGCQDGRWGSWTEWGACSATCNEGFRSRSRIVDVHPNYCGKPVVGVKEEYKQCDDKPACTEVRDCILKDWAQWSTCSCTCFGVRERNRAIHRTAIGGGKACDGDALKQIAPCNPEVDGKFPLGCGENPPVDCVLSNWTSWTPCTKTCGGGQKERTRTMVTVPENGGKPCETDLEVTAACNTQSCDKDCTDCVWGKWSDWGDCSKCGGQRFRHRAITQMPNHCGKQCDLESSKEVSNCTSHCVKEVYCVWSDWSTASGCGVGCGPSTGMRTRALGTAKEASNYLFMGPPSATCSGSQLRLHECDTLMCKPACVPRNCNFAMWSEWAAPSCTGLCERERVIENINNECGFPCSGPLLETKRCEINCKKPEDCILSTWSEWNEKTCNEDGGQKLRQREIEQIPQNGGKACEGPLSEIAPCAKHKKVVPCEMGRWTEWTTCTASCGGGLQTRMRTISLKSVGGGPACEDSLEEMQACATEPCKVDGVIDCILSEWESWSECGGGCGGPNQMDRKRQITQLPENGKPCAGPLEETKTCGTDVVDCVLSDWTVWDSCDKKCAGGQQRRHRQVHTFPSNGGKACPENLMEIQGCNQDPCGVVDCAIGAWEEWGPCSSSCDIGQQTRKRVVIHERNPTGVGCTDDLAEVRSCKASDAATNAACATTDCKWGDWSDWDGCTCSCDGGQRTRNRHIAQSPRGHGKPCNPSDKEQMVPCNTQPCEKKGCVDGDGLWGEWDPWTPCSATCGGGTTFRTRKIVRMAKSCGTPVAGPDRETDFCNVGVSCIPAVDCAFSDWGVWTECSATCDGIQRRSRRIGRYGRGNGLYCLGALKETHPCNPGPGQDFPADCKKQQPVDCAMGTWQEWSLCTATCGGGTQKRLREILQMPKFGGKACDGALDEVEECARNECPGPKEQDCVFGDWQDWGACGKCGGQRKRFRSIKQYASAGGRNCDLEANEETGSCPRTCHTKMYCTWSDWQQWGICTAQCGAGERTRRRYLSLSSTESEPPAPVQVQKYAVLGERMENFESSRVKDLGLAFSAGCSSFLLVLGVVRVFSRPRQFARDSQIASNRQSGAYSVVQQRARAIPSNTRESEMPLVGN